MSFRRPRGNWENRFLLPTVFFYHPSFLPSHSPVFLLFIYPSYLSSLFFRSFLLSCRILLFSPLLLLYFFLTTVLLSSLPSIYFLHIIIPSLLPSFFPFCLPSFLPSFLPAYLPSFLPAYLPSFLLSFHTSLLTHFHHSFLPSIPLPSLTFFQSFLFSDFLTSSYLTFPFPFSVFFFPLSVTSFLLFWLPIVFLTCFLPSRSLSSLPAFLPSSLSSILSSATHITNTPNFPSSLIHPAPTLPASERRHYRVGCYDRGECGWIGVWWVGGGLGNFLVIGWCSCLNPSEQPLLIKSRMRQHR